MMDDSGQSLTVFGTFFHAAQKRATDGHYWSVFDYLPLFCVQRNFSVEAQT